MAQNKNALIRYKTIDKCLQNTYRQWTLNDLIEACSEALYEFEGKQTNISKRTIQLDIENMRSEKLGYNAPIEVYDKKYYRYAYSDFSITDIPLTETDINVLSETVAMLKQFKDFSLFKDVADILHRLEDKIYAEKSHTSPIIHFDKNENLKGLHYLEPLYQAIVKKITLQVTYKSFQSSSENQFLFYPYILKEYNNRWFLIGKKHKETSVSNLALDRIIALDFDFKTHYPPHSFNADEYYKNAVGVTVNKGMQPQYIELKVNKQYAPYVLTKPIHCTQKLLQTYSNQSIVICLQVVINFELEREILSFGKGIEVLSPESFRKQIQRQLKGALNNYE